MAFQWTAENCIKLIDNYKQHPCLWNISDRRYKCKKSKNESWKEIALATGCENKDEAQRKMRTLLSQFYRERKKYHRTTQSGDYFISKWFAYTSLMFLREKKNRRTREEFEPKEESSSGSDIDYTSLQYLLIDSDDENKKSKNINWSHRHSLKSKSNSNGLGARKVCAVLRSMYSSQRVWDRYDVFVENMAYEIRNLRTDYARTTIKRLISNLLYEAKNGSFDNPYKKSQLYLYNTNFPEKPTSMWGPPPPYTSRNIIPSPSYISTTTIKNTTNIILESIHESTDESIHD